MLLQAQMRFLKRHADDLLDSILNHPNLTESQINQMDTKQKEELRLIVKAADDVTQPAPFPLNALCMLTRIAMKCCKHCSMLVPCKAEVNPALC